MRLTKHEWCKSSIAPNWESEFVRNDLRRHLRIRPASVKEVNDFLLDPKNPVINDILRVVDKYGTPEEINKKAREVRQLPHLKKRLRKIRSPYLRDLEWLEAQRDKEAFVSIPEFRRQVLGKKADKMKFDKKHAVTLEISAFQYFPWLMTEAKQAIKNRELMPGRYIRVRKMKEQEKDQGDILAVAAAMQIVGASYVETLDTKGTDGSNVHLGGPATITGYFGGIGQPNDHALSYIDEFLYYYTEYGIQQVLNINPGTVLLGYIIHKLGIDMEFKISVFMGNDNPYSILWTLIAARLFSRDDGSVPLIGFNLSNSVDVKTIETGSYVRKKMGLEDNVKIEHHITETWKSIVRQPYNRRDDLIRVSDHVANISAKHEGGEIETEEKRKHPSDILDYFRDKEEVLASGEMPYLEENYMDKHESVNLTAKALTRNGLSFAAARNLHSER